MLLSRCRDGTGTRRRAVRRGLFRFGQCKLRAVACAATVVLFVAAPPAGQVFAQLENPPADRAEALLQRGYLFHLLGAYEQAVEHFRRSIDARPTAEGHTYLGWSLGHLGRLDEAIAECKKAIAIDPDFGNPYNDIGVYLVQLGRSEEAVPWLEKAMRAKRYCCYQYPHSNLGRILLQQGRLAEAKRLFERALEFDPDYLPAKTGLEEIRRSWL